MTAVGAINFALGEKRTLNSKFKLSANNFQKDQK
jgi:hypothetical protein